MRLRISLPVLALFSLFACQSIDAGVKTRPHADPGNAAAQNKLGFNYANGLGVQQDDDEAVKWFRKSAEQEIAEAQYNLGVMYDHGRGVVQSYREAVRWYRKSAEQGFASAQYNLGSGPINY